MSDAITGKQALMNHFRALVNHAAAGHKPTTEQDFDALDRLLTDVGHLLDCRMELIWQLRQRTARITGESEPPRPSLEVMR